MAKTTVSRARERKKLANRFALSGGSSAIPVTSDEDAINKALKEAAKRDERDSGEVVSKFIWVYQGEFSQYLRGRLKPLKDKVDVSMRALHSEVGRSVGLFFLQRRLQAKSTLAHVVTVQDTKVEKGCSLWPTPEEVVPAPDEKLFKVMEHLDARIGKLFCGALPNTLILVLTGHGDTFRVRWCIHTYTIMDLYGKKKTGGEEEEEEEDSTASQTLERSFLFSLSLSLPCAADAPLAGNEVQAATVGNQRQVWSELDPRV